MQNQLSLLKVAESALLVNSVSNKSLHRQSHAISYGIVLLADHHAISENSILGYPRTPTFLSPLMIPSSYCDRPTALEVGSLIMDIPVKKTIHVRTSQGRIGTNN